MTEWIESRLEELAPASVEGQATCRALQSHDSDTERVCDQGGGFDQQGLRAGGAKNLWIKKSRRKKVSRLKIATYNVRTLLRDEHTQELEEELGEFRLVWDVFRIGEVRRRRGSFTSLQNGHLHSKANNGSRSRLSHKQEMERHG